MFIPSADKLYTQKLAFKCNQNPKLFILNVSGQGINYTVEMVPFSDKPKKDQAKDDAPPRKGRGSIKQNEPEAEATGPEML